MPEYKHWQNVAVENDACFITSTIEDFIPILQVPQNAMLLLNTLDFYRDKYGFLIYAYVVMREHIHLFIQFQGKIAVQKLMADFKRYTSKKLIEYCINSGRRDWLDAFEKRGQIDGERYSVWQRSYRSVPLTKEDDAMVKIAYMHNNPLRRELVDVPEQWPYSSAAAYAGGDGAIRVDFIG